jgi:hypothetical protein
MDQELKPGVYQHKDGDFYQVLFVAHLQCDVKKDDDVDITITDDALAFYALKRPGVGSRGGEQRERLVLTARAHADYVLFRGAGAQDDPHPGDPLDVAVYVPLYAHKPGRRISVRRVADFNEEIVLECEMGDEGLPTKTVNRFTYIGDVIPPEML